MLLSDREIRRRVKEEQMIVPFAEKQRADGIISYGLSSYGYDVRLHTVFKVFTNNDPTIIVDPKNFDARVLHEHIGDSCIIPPHSFVLGRTMEWFKIPRDILTLCIGKSTYARCGIIVNVTPLEPEWRGFVTLEISNTSPLPAKIYAGEGICQFLFLKAVTQCETSYADRNGKYQDQTDITMPKVLTTQMGNI